MCLRVPHVLLAWPSITATGDQPRERSSVSRKRIVAHCYHISHTFAARQQKKATRRPPPTKDERVGKRDADKQNWKAYQLRSGEKGKQQSGKPPTRLWVARKNVSIESIIMGLSTAERNKKKRERKKREREERLKQEEEAKRASQEAQEDKAQTPDVEIEYVSEPILSEEVEGLRKFRELGQIDSSNNEGPETKNSTAVKVEDYDDEDGDGKPMSKRKLREMLRPSVADLKRRVDRPELVEAHDVTAADPEFLLELKSVPGTVPVPRHWGRKRKYLQGKVSSRYFYVAFYAALVESNILLYFHFESEASKNHPSNSRILFSKLVSLRSEIRQRKTRKN